MRVPHPRSLRRSRLAPAVLSLAAALAAWPAATLAHDDPDDDDAVRHRASHRPDFLRGEVRVTRYDGVADDLLTAGLGKTGLAAAAPPAHADPLAPTAAELRRAAIHTNYRALVDMTEAGGYGRLYGPNIAPDGSVTAGEGKVAGVEYLAYSRGADPDHHPRHDAPQNVTLMVQIPAHFDPGKPCIMTATSSGSRGVYGAISAAEWGLKRGCAVAYTDKGTGAAPHDLMADTVARIDGTRGAAAEIDRDAHFDAGLDPAAQAAFNAATPNRYAFKHAHSGRNPEQDWGRFTLQAVQFAFWALNQEFPGRAHRGGLFRPGNTLVIASSISNGGGAAVAAAELDEDRWIDGVAVSEPSVQLPEHAPITVSRGGVRLPVVGRSLFDYMTQANLYQSCAALSAQVAGAPGLPFVVAAFAANRCASLHDKGLLEATTTAAQADEALARLAAHGWEPEAAFVHASHAAFEIPSAVSVTYANAYGRARVTDALCGYSYAAVAADFTVAPLAPAALASMFATGNGVPPSAGVHLVNDLSPGVPLRDLVSFSPSTLRQDFNLDGALCLRGLLDGNDRSARRVQHGIDATRRSGDLRGKPALIVHGRSDALLPVNHTSRAYTAFNSHVEGHRSRLSYVEVTNAQHFDAFIGLPALLPGFDSRFVSLHVYLFRALDAMYAHLADGRPLPPSQLVRTTPRGGTPGAAPALTEAHLPPIALHPADGDRIRAHRGNLAVPD